MGMRIGMGMGMRMGMGLGIGFGMRVRMGVILNKTDVIYRFRGFIIEWGEPPFIPINHIQIIIVEFGIIVGGRGHTSLTIFSTVIIIVIIVITGVVIGMGITEIKV